MAATVGSAEGDSMMEYAGREKGPEDQFLPGL